MKGSSTGGIYIRPELLEEAKKNGISKGSLARRLGRGWPEKDAVSLPLNSRCPRKQFQKRSKAAERSIDEVLEIARQNNESYGQTVARLDGYLE